MSSPAISLDQFQQLLDAINSKPLPAHLFMPPEGFSFDYASYIPLPGVGTGGTIVTFTVPDGFNGVINRVSNVFVGTGWTEGSGALIYQILANSGVIRNYDKIVASLGSVSNPSQIAGILVKEGQVVQLTITNASLAVGGAQVGGRLSGWFYPTSLEPEGTWL